jgi:L-asparagine oxygenase
MSRSVNIEGFTGLFHAEPLTARDAEQIALDVCAAAEGVVDSVEWISAARRASINLPAEILTTLREFRRYSGEKGALLLRGLPVDESTVGATPTVKGSVQRSATVPGALLMMSASVLGEPIAFRPEKSGAMVQDVVPVPGQEEFQGNAGSVLLEFHNENAFHPFRPDYVLLLCLRADHDGVAGLTTVCIRQVLPFLSEPAREALFAPEYITAAPPSFGDMKAEPVPHGVLSGVVEDPDLRVDFAATQALTDRAVLALRELQRLFADHAQVLRLVPGDMAIVDNRVTVHGRTGFQPRYDGKDRWLQRTFSLVDFRAARTFREAEGHVLV